MAELDDLFSVDLNTKMDFLEDKKSVNSDGMYRVDLNKVKDKKRGYRSVIRFLPNLTKEMTFGQSAIEKISHYVNIKNVKELSGFFDSPKNFNEDCALSSLYYTMSKSGNAIQVEKAKCLQYSRKYYSYVLIMEDEQQPELVGKIMIFQYGKIIQDKIIQEKTGEISGVECNVFDWIDGKDFVLIAKEIQTGEITYPDYKNAMFRQESSSLPIYNKEKAVFGNVPLSEVEVDGKMVKKINPKFHQIVKDFLLDRDHDLTDYAPKKLTPEQNGKINEITAFLTGTAPSGFNSKASASDFDLEESMLPETDTFKASAADEDDEDFFANM